MKKCLLSLAMSLLLGSSLASAELAKCPLTVEKAPTAAKALSRAATEDGYQLRFCGDLYSWYRLVNGNNFTYKCYVEITPEIATSLAGNKLTDVTFGAFLESSKTKPGSVFITETLTGDTVVNKAVTIENSYKGSYALPQTVVLDEPYEIKEGVGFTYGYIVTKCSANDYPIGVDAEAPTPFAGNVDVYSSTGSLATQASLAQDAGCNLFLYANTVGEKKGLENIYALSYISLGDFTLPVVNVADGSLGVQVGINNFGSNPVTSIGYIYSLNGADPVAGILDTDLPGETEAAAVIPVPVESTGRGAVQVVVTTINGQECNLGAELSFLAIDGEGYERKFVVEEGTGTGCGYCPRGIVGMESMSKAYPEKFIGIAIHCDWFGNDPMTVSSYQPFLNNYFDGLPSCIINRDPIFNISPSFDYLDYCYGYWLDQPGAAAVDLKVVKPMEDEKTLNVEASTSFAFDDASANYALAFVIIEDGYKGMQANYFAGGANGPMDGWESKGQRVSWTFSDTARDIFNVWGINGSIPASVEKGTAYEYSYDLSLDHVKSLEQTSVIALLLDKTTGTIMNAEKVEYADYVEPSGISSAAIDLSAPVEYYNIQGVRMDGDNLPAGLYIIRQGDKVQKSIIR